MKKTLLALAILFAASLALAQSEGVADYKITGDSMTGTGRMYVSKAGYRVEWNMELSDSARRGRGPRDRKTTIVGKLSEPDVVYMVNDDSKTYSTFNTKEAREETARSNKEKYTVERLGTETVAGFSCQNARLKSTSGTEMELCVTKDLSVPAGWLAAMNRQGGGGGGWSALRDAGIEGLPVRWTTKPSRGGHGGPVTMELTKFEKRPVPASTFEVPAGYKKTDAMSVGMSPEQRRQMDEALKNMTPEQRKQYEEMMKSHGQPPSN